MALSELDKLECAVYTIKIIDDAVKKSGTYHSETGDWLDTAKDEVHKRLSRYLSDKVRRGL